MFQALSLRPFPMWRTGWVAQSTFNPSAERPGLSTLQEFPWWPAERARAPHTGRAVSSAWAVMASRGRTIGFSDPGNLRAGRVAVASRGHRASAAASVQRAELHFQQVVPPAPGEILELCSNLASPESPERICLIVLSAEEWALGGFPGQAGC